MNQTLPETPPIATLSAQLEPGIFLQLISKTSEGITLADVYREDCPLVFVNEGFCKLTGYSAEEVIGRNCRFLQGDDTEQTAVAMIDKALKEKLPCTVDLINYRKDGTKFWNRLALTPIYNAQGEAQYFAGIQSDISASQQLSDQRQIYLAQYTRQVKEVNEALAQLAKNIQYCSTSMKQTMREMMQPGLHDESADLLPQLKSKMAMLDNDVSLLMTILQTNSSDILQYVKQQQQ